MFIWILLEDRLYRYVRQPIGFCKSGHRFVNMVSRKFANWEIAFIGTKKSFYSFLVAKSF